MWEGTTIRSRRAVPARGPGRGRSKTLAGLLLLLGVLVALGVARNPIIVKFEQARLAGDIPGLRGIGATAEPGNQPVARAAAPVAASPARPAPSPSAAVASATRAAVAAPPSSAPTWTSGLTGQYRTLYTWAGASQYRGEVRVTNLGPQQVGWWRVVITLPKGLSASAVRGARMTQSGRVVTFTPTDSTAQIPAKGYVTLDFAVNGPGKPTACTVNGRACAGIPE